MIDLESEKFIRWTLKRLEDPEYYNLMKMRCMLGLRKFLGKSKTEIMEILKLKLEKGGAEHGAPIYEPEVIDKELEMEFIDILGWTMIKQYNLKRKKIAKTSSNPKKQ